MTYAESRKEKTIKIIQIIYLVFACIMLALPLYQYFRGISAVALAKEFGIVWAVFAVFSFIMGKMWKQKIYWVLFALFLVRTLRLIFPDPVGIEQVPNVVYWNAYALLCCFVVIFAIRPEARERFLKGICMGWIFAMTAIAIYAICTIWNNTTSQILGSETIYLLDGRLYIIGHPVITGLWYSINLGIAFVGFCLVRSRWLKGLFAFSILIFFITCSLTSTRTSYIVNAVQAGLVGALMLRDFLYKRTKDGTQFHIIRDWVIAVIAFVALMAALVYIQFAIVDGFNAIKGHGIVISTANAEDITAAQASIDKRDFKLDSADSLLTGRVSIWESVIQVIKNEPQLLLWGSSGYMPFERVHVYRETIGVFKAFHCHNAYLQTLLENGIPGFVLYISFVIYFLRAACSLMLNRNLPWWQRFICLPGIGSVVEELVDMTTYVNLGYPQTVPAYVFMGATIAFYKANQRKQKKVSIKLQHDKETGYYANR